MIFNLQLQDLQHFEYFRNVGCYEISYVFVSYKIYCTLKSIHIASIWSAALYTLRLNHSSSKTNELQIFLVKHPQFQIRFYPKVVTIHTVFQSWASHAVLSDDVKAVKAEEELLVRDSLQKVGESTVMRFARFHDFFSRDESRQLLGRLLPEYISRRRVRICSSRVYG